MILTLVATKATQGQRKNDFSHADEGELVGLSHSECDRETVDGRCGCRRSLSGLTTGKGTTTLRVAEFAGTVEDLADKIYQHNLAGGWVRQDDPTSVAEWRSDAQRDAQGLVRVANFFGAGTILERRGSRFQERKERAA